jgi:hypothetical protein
MARCPERAAVEPNAVTGSCGQIGGHALAYSSMHSGVSGACFTCMASLQRDSPCGAVTAQTSRPMGTSSGNACATIDGLAPACSPSKATTYAPTPYTIARGLARLNTRTLLLLGLP